MKRMFYFRTDLRRGTAVLLLFLVLCAGAGASVFKTLGQSWSGWVPVSGLPWEQAYKTKMVVNGQRTEMYVYTARYSEPAADQLKNVLASIGATVQSMPSGNGGVATLNGYEVRYAISSPPSDPRHYIFLSYCEPNGTEKQAFPVLLYPNGKVLSTVSDVNSKTDCASVKTTDTPTEVHDFYRDRLTADGWTLVKPCTYAAGEGKGLAIYRKNGQICFVNVVSNKSLYSTVSILVEKGN